MSDEATVEVAAYIVSRLPDTNVNHAVWSIRVEAAGHGRWAVRNLSRCLNKQGEWEEEHIPSSRTAAILKRTRWDSADEAIEAAKAAEPHLCWNGLTPAEVLARV